VHLSYSFIQWSYVDRPKYKIAYSKKKGKKQSIELMKVDFKTFVEGYIEIALPKTE
jgi:hypothetical protein